MILTTFVSTRNPQCLIQRLLIEEWPLTYLTETADGTEVLSKTYFVRIG